MSCRCYKGRTAVVTGGASGIGAALAESLTAAGATVIVADIDEAAAEQLVARLGRGRAVRLDVRDGAAVDHFFDAAGSVDFVFNNAGVALTGEFHHLSREEVDRVLDVNLRGCVYVAHAAFKRMVAQGHGHLVNTASAYGLVPGGGNMPYITAKFGVVGMSEALRIEGHDYNVRVSAVCPGFIQTRLLEKLATVNLDADEVARMIPFKAVQPTDAARVILDGVARNRALITFPRYTRILTWLYRLLPGIFFRFSLHSLRRLRNCRKK